MKKLALIVALGLASLTITTSQAADIIGTQGFNVSINLTPVCTFSSINTLTFNYTSNQGTAATTTPSAFTTTCTVGTAFRLSLGSGEAAGVYTATDTAGATPTNLNYTLQINDADNTNALVASTTNLTANTSVRNFALSGTVPENQAGTCTGASVDGLGTCATSTITTRQVTITY